MKRWMCLLALVDLPEAIDGTWLIVFELMTEGQKLESNFMNPEMPPFDSFLDHTNLWFWSESAVNFSMREVNLRILGSHQHLEPRKPMGKAFENPWENGSMASWPKKIPWNPISGGDLVTWLLRRRPPQMCSCWSRKWPKGWRSWKTNCLRRPNSSIFRGYLWWAKWLNLARSG